MTLDEFQHLIVSSGLVSEADAATVRSELTCNTLQSLGDLFVAKQLITPWQRRMLLQGRYKGFFFEGEYKILQALEGTANRMRFLAENTVFRERVILSVEARPDQPHAYEVEKLGSKSPLNADSEL